jgi:hypothetical protein
VVLTRLARVITELSTESKDATLALSSIDQIDSRANIDEKSELIVEDFATI